ncbi:hypothetical protein C8R42DRAFT_660283 [Lentinula raphanica]|nr:hypothetical protein C8R42DRAFT_660283 [Lentinula raphanica]
MRFLFTTNTCLGLLALLPPLIHAMPVDNSNPPDSANAVMSQTAEYELATILLQPSDYAARDARIAAYSFVRFDLENGGRFNNGLPQSIRVDKDLNSPIQTKRPFPDFGFPFRILVGRVLGFRFMHQRIAHNGIQSTTYWAVWTTTRSIPQAEPINFAYFCTKEQGDHLQQVLYEGPKNLEAILQLPALTVDPLDMPPPPYTVKNEHTPSHPQPPHSQHSPSRPSHS